MDANAQSDQWTESTFLESLRGQEILVFISEERSIVGLLLSWDAANFYVRTHAGDTLVPRSAAKFVRAHEDGADGWG